MSLSTYNKRIQEKLFARLEAKPSWGKEQLKTEIREVMLEVISELADEAMSRQPQLELVPPATFQEQ